MDMSHAAPLTQQTRVRAGDYEDLADSSVVIVTAGANQRPGQTRLDLVKANQRVFQKIIPQVAHHAPECFLVVATNPVDVLTYAAYKLSGFPPHRVIGSGTVLDSARLQTELGALFGVSPRSVGAFVIGEHGDSEVVPWSLASIQGMRLRDFCEGAGLSYDEDAIRGCATRTRDAAYEIIQKKGVTDYAIAAALKTIVQALLRSEDTLLTVSRFGSYAGVGEVCLSVPVKVNCHGAHVVSKLTLSADEEVALRKSALQIKEATDTLELPLPN
jgi:L-lactate dehydrogenase